jgi:hypothetical protein
MMQHFRIKATEVPRNGSPLFFSLQGKGKPLVVGPDPVLVEILLGPVTA